MAQNTITAQNRPLPRPSPTKETTKSQLWNTGPPCQTLILLELIQIDKSIETESRPSVLVAHHFCL